MSQIKYFDGFRFPLGKSSQYLIKYCLTLSRGITSWAQCSFYHVVVCSHINNCICIAFCFLLPFSLQFVNHLLQNNLSWYFKLNANAKRPFSLKSSWRIAASTPRQHYVANITSPLWQLCGILFLLMQAAAKRDYKQGRISEVATCAVPDEALAIWSSESPDENR